MERQPIEIWSKVDEGHLACITTNGVVLKDGTNVMGGGVAREAALRYPRLPYVVGKQIRLHGNHVRLLGGFGLIMFPTITINFRASLPLVRQSAQELVRLIQGEVIPVGKWTLPVYLPSPGTGIGGLAWPDVEEVLEGVFGRAWGEEVSNFVVVTTKPEAVVIPEMPVLLGAANSE